MKEEKANIDDIDELDAVAEALDEGEADGPEVPEHLVLQPCMLPRVLMEKKELTGYLQEHAIGHDDCKVMEITEKERDLYERYSSVAKNRRVTKLHFVAALRLFHAGYEVWPNREKDLNDMKVE